VGPVVLISLVILAASFGVSWLARRQAVQFRAVSSASVIPLAQLTEDAAAVAKEMGSGSFREMVKIRGRIICESPLVAELSHLPCVSYRFSVTREYEQVLWEKDARGNSVQQLRRQSEVVAFNEATTAFSLDDGTARILVQPDGAKIDRVKSHSSFQPVQASGTAFGVGSFVLNIGASPGGTLGYRYEEFCLPLDQEVTVVAEAGDEGGKLVLRCPETKGVPFLVSTRSAHDLVRKGQTTAAVLNGVSIGLAAVAVLIFLLGVVR
jgi:hypothetical protein